MIKLKRVVTFLLSVSLCLAGAAQAVTDTYTASGTWTAPAGVTSVTVDVWGGGGAGGGNPTNSDGGGGGGGGGYSRSTITVVPGSNYTVTVGAGGIAVDQDNGGSGGDSWFSTVGTILANGGAGGAVATTAGGAGGAGGALGVGTTRHSGGDGGTGRNSNTGRGAPGGSSAGTAANGTDGPVTWTTATAAAPPAGGGIGGNGGNANSQDGFAPASGNGGGGGGGAERQTAGGNGAGGLVAITYTLPVFPTVVSINLASPDPTNPATSVSWTITFSASVTGVDDTDFSLVAGGGVTGAAITSVTGSGTTWTVTADTGSGYGTLGLNLVDNNTIIDGGGMELGGTGLGDGNFTGQVYMIDAPLTCITDNFSTGTLDTSLWDVKTIQGPYLPQVVNAGGGDYRLRLTDTNNNEATFAQLKRIFPAAGNKVVLEIDYFAYGGSGADGIAIAFSDATIASTTGGFGGSLGYAQNGSIAGFGGGWLGVGLDEYGNFPNPTESRNNYPAGWVAPAPANVAAGFYKTNVSVRGSGSGTSGYSLLANTGLLATPVAPASGAAGATPYRYRITFDHSNGVNAYVTVERDTTGTGASYATLVPKFDAKGSSSGQAAVPANWLVSFTGSTGGATNNHEFKQVKICANTIIGGGPHHLEIDHPSGTGVTCTPSTLTIKACADAACTTPYTAGVTGTLSATGTPTVNWSGASGFSIPVGSGSVTKDVQVTTPGSVVFDATSTPAPTVATTCNFGTPACTFTSADSALLVSAPNHIAESASTLTIQAVKSAPGNPLVCVPGMTGNKTVNLKCAYTDPATGTLPVRVGGVALNAINNSTAACDATGQMVNLIFDATGVATPTLQYADVGQMNVTAGYTGIAGTIDEGLNMAGSGTFIAAPASFAFSAVTAGPIKAGNSFSATITAKNNAGATTPNFGKESAPEGVTLGTTLVSPAGGSNPSLANNIIAGGAFTNGVATVNNLSWGEVGNIDLTAALASGSYLGSGLTATGTSATVGPFIPDHFVLVPQGVINACSGGALDPFTYMDQNYTISYTLTAMSANSPNTVTTNYEGAFAKLDPTNVLDMDFGYFDNATGTPLSASGRLGVTLSDAFNNGVVTATTTFNLARASTPDGYFADFQVGINPVDADGVALVTLNMDPAITGSDTHGLLGSADIRYGRLNLQNNFGSELLPVTMAASTEYYDTTAAGFLTNIDDSCTVISTDDILLFNNQEVKADQVLGDRDIIIDVAPTTKTTTLMPTPPLPPVALGTPFDISFVAGLASFDFTAPGVLGYVDVEIHAPAYLLYDFDGDGTDDFPLARGNFGIFKGSENIIYIKEMVP